MRNFARAWIALLVSVAIIGALTVTASTSLAASSGPEPDIFTPGPAVKGSRDVSAPGGRFSEGRGRDHEVVDMRTSDSNTFVTSDGKYETELFPGKVNYKDSKGHYQPVDNALVADGGSGFRNKANDYSVHLPHNLNAPTRIEQDGYWLSYVLEGAGGNGVVEDRTITYGGAFEGVDVVVTAENAQVKENLVLSSAQAQHGFDYTIRMDPHLAGRLSPDGSVEFVDETGVSRFTIPPPVVYDGATEPAIAPGVAWELEPAQGNAAVLSVTVADAWLTDPARIFPVTIDPTVSQPLSPQRDCTISSTSSTSLCTSSNNLDVGFDGGGGGGLGGGGGPVTKRALLRFNMGQTDSSGKPIFPDDAQVLNAQLGLYLTSANTTAKPQLVVRRLTRDWTNSATWASSGNSNWSTLGGDFASDLGYGGPNPNSNPGDVDLSAGYKNWWYPTRLVDRWIGEGSNFNNGLIVKQADESVTNILHFTSMEGASNQLPKLTVTWDAGGLGEQKGFTFNDTKLTDRSTLSINPAGGNVLVKARDVEIKGTGLDLHVDRYYNNLIDTPGMTGDINGGVLGPKWTLDVGTDIGLQPYSDGSLVYYGPTGYRLPFAKSSYNASDYIAPPGLDATLKKDGAANEYVLTFHKSLEEFHFNLGGFLLSHRDKNGNTISFQYDVNGYLTKVLDTQTRATTFTYNAGKLTQITDPVGRTYSYTYLEGSLYSVTDPANWTTYYQYDRRSELTKITDPIGNQTALTYAWTTAGAGGGSLTPAALMRVASMTRITNNSTQAGHVTKYAYSGKPTDLNDARQDPNKPIKACCETTVTEPRSTDTNPITTKYAYDGDDRVTRVIDAKGNRTSQSYTSDQNVESYVDASAGEFKFTYDDTGEDMTDTASPNDSVGGSSVSGQSTIVRYRNSNERLKHLPTCSIDSLGHETYFNYDNNGNLTKVRLGAEGNLGIADPSDDCMDAPTSAKSRYDYTYTSQATDGVPSGLLKTISDANGNDTPSDPSDDGITTFTYFPSGDLKRIDYPGAQQGSVSYTYDSLSRVDTMTDGKGQLTRFSYDALDRVTQITYADATRVLYTYDQDGNMTYRSESPGGGTTFAYNPKNELIKRTNPGGSFESFTYDAAGNLSTLTASTLAAGQQTVIYKYDNLNLLTQVTEPDDANKFTTFNYDANYNRISTAFPNGVTSKTDYNHSNQPTLIRATRDDSGTTTVLMSLAYDYSQNGRLTSKIQKLTDNDAGQTTTYDYDLVGRLRSASTNNGGDTYNYTYDPNGNMKSRGIVGQGTRTYNYNKVNQLTCSYTGSSCVTTDPATLRYDYDQNGSLYTKITSAGSKAYRYNARNQMTSAAKETGGTSTMTYLDASSTERVTKDSMSYTYNLLGLSSQKPSGGSGTYFTRDDKSKLLEERVGNGTGFAHYYYLTDALGSVVAVTNAGGSKVGGGNYKYDPYGRTLNDPLANSGVSNPFGFVGGYTDSETGFVKFGTRYYDPSVARWTQQDPQKGQLSDPMSLNPYLYVKNDPLNAVDPSGRLSFFESFLAGVATTVGCGVFGLTTAGIGAGLAVFIGGPEAAPVGAAIGFPVGCELAGTAIGEFIDSNSS